MARRKLYPMPIEGIVDHPDFIAMPAAGTGILFRLSLHFWRTQCRPLPIADHELRCIARAHSPTWRRWKSSVLKVFEAIRPELEAYYHLRESHGTTLSVMAQMRQSRQRLKALQKLQSPQTNVPAYATGIVPARSPEKRLSDLLRS
jgi:hypothetical protein